MNTEKRSRKQLSIILKLIIITAAVLGTWLCYTSDSDTFMGGRVVFRYFTIQSNIGVALIELISLIVILSCRQYTRPVHILRLMGAVSITLTGMVFCFVLAPVLGSKAWELQSCLAHAVVPVATVADFILDGSPNIYRKHDVLWVTVPPLLYACYAGIGYITGIQFGGGLNYPYFFLNWGSKAGAFGFSDELPFIGTGWWILILLIFLLLVGKLYIFIVNRKK